VSATGKVPVRETLPDRLREYELASPLPMEPVVGQQDFLPYLRLFWEHRRFLFRTGTYALLASILIALLLPVRYQSLTRLMPPDSQSASGIGMLAAMAGHNGAAGLGGFAGDLLGVKSSGALFVGILGSESVQDRLIDEFHLMKIYHDSKIEDARKDLAECTGVSEDRKSGIITIGVTDPRSQSSCRDGEGVRWGVGSSRGPGRHFFREARAHIP